MAFGGYDGSRDRYRFLSDSYWGGERYKYPSAITIGDARITRYKQLRDSQGRLEDEFYEEVIAKLSSYLSPHPGETLQEFNIRVALASYINIIQPIVDAYVDAVTSNISRDLGLFESALSNLNGQGQTWNEFITEVATWSCLYGWVATVYDTPEENPARSLGEEQDLGISLRASIIHPTAIAWIKTDRDGNLEEFAFVDEPYLPRESEPTDTEVSLYVYTKSSWSRYDTKINSSNPWVTIRKDISTKTPNKKGLIPTPGKIPVVFSFFRQDTSSNLPQGISLVSDAVDIARQIYNSNSWIEEIHRKTAHPFLAVPEPAAGGQLNPETRIMIGPGSALGYNAQTGAPSWVQPSAESTRELREHIHFLMACALRTTGLEVTSGDSPSDASGTALKIRSRDFDSRCVKFARNMEGFEKKAISIISDILNREAPAQPKYPKRFNLPDSSQDLARAMLALNSIGDIMEEDGKLAIIRQILDSALSLSEDELNNIVKKVKENLLLLQNGSNIVVDNKEQNVNQETK